MKVYEDGQLVADDDEMTSWVVRRKAKSTRVVASSRPVVAHNQSELEGLWNLFDELEKAIEQLVNIAKEGIYIHRRLNFKRIKVNADAINVT